MKLGKYKTLKERDEAICKMLSNGERRESIALKFGLSLGSVKGIAQKYKIDTRKKNKTNNSYTCCGKYFKLILKDGKIVYIDYEDYKVVKDYCWCYNDKSGVVTTIENKVVKMHHLILGTNQIIDHINGNNRDNRKANLRLADEQKNSFNRVSKRNKFGVNGVSKAPSGKYRAKIRVNGKELSLGTFVTLNEAINARIQAECKYYGEFAPYKRYKIRTGELLPETETNENNDLQVVKGG